MATSDVKIVQIPGNPPTHWIVSRGRGHQITGTNLLRIATVMYGPPVEQAEMDFTPDVIAFDVFGGPGEIEKVLAGEKPDPFGVWLVTTSTPQVPITPEEAALIASDPDAPVDTTVDDDAVSIQLPPMVPWPAANPEGAEANPPSVAEQIQGATGDRTPGLAMPDIPEYVSPTTPVPAAEEPPAPAPSGPAPAPAEPRPPYERPQEPRPPYERGSAQPPPPYERGSAQPPPPYERGSSQPRPPYERGAAQTPSYASSATAALRPVNTLPPPRFPLLRTFLQRTGQNAAWLDSIERGQ